MRPFQPRVVRGFSKVHAHDDLQPVAEFLAQRQQAAGVVQRALGIVDRAGADDDQQAVVAPGEDVFHGGAAGLDGRAARSSVGQLVLEDGGRDEALGGNDPEVLEREHGGKAERGRKGRDASGRWKAAGGQERAALRNRFARLSFSIT